MDRPQTANARYAAGLKRGMLVVVTEDVVVAAWTKPGAPTPSVVLEPGQPTPGVVFGVQVK